MAGFIFHFIFAVFTVAGIIGFLRLRAEVMSLRSVLLPLLTSPTHATNTSRSLLTRGIATAAREISYSLQRPVTIQASLNEGHTPAHIVAGLRLLCRLIWTKESIRIQNTDITKEKIFFYREKFLSSQEFIQEISKKNSNKEILLTLQPEEANKTPLWQIGEKIS